MRGTSRDPERVAELDRGGIEGVLADPARVGTLASALEHVGVVIVLLGSAVGSDAELRELHRPRLQMLMTRILDTTVRGVLYEGTGTVEASVLGAGAALVQEFCEHSRIPYAVIERVQDPQPALDEVDRLLNR